MYHRLSGAAGEGGGELGHVAHDVVDARAAGGMRIGLREQPRSRGTHVLAPDLGVAEKEALLRSKPIDLGLRVFFERFH